MVRRRASTCFAFMLPKNQVGQLTCSQEPRGTLRGVSNKGVSSLHLRCIPIANPNPKYPGTFQPTAPANGRSFRRRGLHASQIARPSDFQHDGPSVCQAFPRWWRAHESGVSCSRPSTRLECRVQEKFGAPRTGSPRCALHLFTISPSARTYSNPVSLPIIAHAAKPRSSRPRSPGSSKSMTQALAQKNMNRQQRDACCDVLNGICECREEKWRLPSSLSIHHLTAPSSCWVATHLHRHRLPRPNRFGESLGHEWNRGRERVLGQSGWLPFFTTVASSASTLTC